MTYVPHTADDRSAMLQAIGVETVDDLFAPIPEPLRLRRDLDIPAGLDENALLRHLKALAGRNASTETHVSFLGAGIYDHFAPAVVDAMLSRGEFLTSYTPYQPEVSQGMLQVLYEYQTLVCQLTGMDLANASMYDAATAVAEAAMMACAVKGRRVVAVSRAMHPHYRAVLRTYADAADVEVRELPCSAGATDWAAPADAQPPACLVAQQPNFFGALEDMQGLVDAAQAAGAMSVACVDPVSLGLLKPPGDYGVDVVVGEGQALGCSPGFGGPLLGFFACRTEHQRRFPGRIVGATVDGQGRRGFTMTLRTREQDIRREKATSNICTNETLLALAATIHLCALGRTGLREVAEGCVHRSHYGAGQLAARAGIEPAFDQRYFKELAVRLPEGVTPAAMNAALADRGILGGYDLSRSYPELAGVWLLCFTEVRTKQEIDGLVNAVCGMVG